MKLLEERIKRDGIVLPGNVLKVDSFLNHQSTRNCRRPWAENLRACLQTPISTAC